MKTLVAYFSAQGTTANIARQLAEHLGADLFEIRPLHPYTDADLRYTNPLARCNKEKFGKKDVPVVGKIENFADYDEVFIGFPICLIYARDRALKSWLCLVSRAACRVPLATILFLNK